MPKTQFFHDGVYWTVREVQAAHVPGSRGERCLILESDGVLRRVWNYPANWWELEGDELWSYVEAVRQAPPSAGVEPATRPTPRAASFHDPHAISDGARVLLAGLNHLRTLLSPAEQERRELLDRCNVAREQMHEAVAAYVDALKHEGVPPERAVVLLKSAMQDGLRDACTDEPTAEDPMRDSVEWCIAAYYTV